MDTLDGKRPERQIGIPMKLTVIYGNDLLFIHEQEPVIHRSKTIELTPEQVDILRPRKVGSSNGKDHFESISMCFIEPNSLK